MKNFFKSFVALFMVAVLGIGVSVPAMAADYEIAGAELEAGSTTEMENRLAIRVGGSSGTCTIRPGSVIGTFDVGTGAKTIKVSITGVSGIIILYFDNLVTGDHRSFTAIGGQLGHSLTYVSPLDDGPWKCSVYLCDNNASGCSYDIGFYR